jgi:hypothetical protein
MTASSAASGRTAGVVEAQVDQGIEARVAGLNAGDERLNDLDRREVAPADAGRQFVGGCVGEFVRKGGRPRYEFNLIGFTFAAESLIDGVPCVVGEKSE